MKVAVICSNFYDTSRETANGTTIFNYSLLTHLARRVVPGTLEVTAFASGNSKIPVPVESVMDEPALEDKKLAVSGRHFLHEQALIAKAFAMQDQFDVFHVNIGDGDIALPFAPFIHKPVLITIHHAREEEYMRRFFSLYQGYENIRYISVTDAQRELFPDLRYAETIHHGVDAELFAFNPTGGEKLMWAGRAIPEKGPDLVVQATRATGHGAKLFGMAREEHRAWFEKDVLKPMVGHDMHYEAGRDRNGLIGEFQSSKAFVLPIRYPEAFGFVFIEAMSCGTPVIAFAKGSVPEVIADGETGFIVNASDDDIRGDWVIKKTGLAGLQEAIERIYAMSDDEYRAMRMKCRERVLNFFTVDRMADAYVQAYTDAAAGRAH